MTVRVEKDYYELVDDFKKSLIILALEEADSIGEAAELLGMTRCNFVYARKSLGVGITLRPKRPGVKKKTSNQNRAARIAAWK